MRLAAIAIASGLLLGGCGGSGGGTTTTGERIVTAPAPETAKLPGGAVHSAGQPEDATGEPAATEASPGQPPSGPTASGELPGSDRSAIAAVVGEYIAALDRHDAGRVCALLAPGTLDTTDLPRARAGCRASLGASIGVRPRKGGPAWRRSVLASVKVERLDDDRARVSATVVHHFSDRKYVSVEDDVIYMQRSAGRWLLAKPSGTLYRAVGYSEPPLQALEPPPGW